MKTDLNLTLARRLRDAMKEQKRSIYRTAKENRIATSTLYGIMTAKSTPTIHTLILLANYLDVSTDWLLGLSHTEKRE